MCGDQLGVLLLKPDEFDLERIERLLRNQLDMNVIVITYMILDILNIILHICFLQGAPSAPSSREPIGKKERKNKNKHINIIYLINI